MTDTNRSQTPLMVAISLVILVLASRLLYLVDRSLREGEGMGLSGEGDRDHPDPCSHGPPNLDGQQDQGGSSSRRTAATPGSSG